MKSLLLVGLLGFLSAISLTATAVRADVVILVNRTPEPVALVADTTIAAQREFRLQPGEVATVPMRAQMKITCPTARPSVYDLEANAAYYFQRGEDGTLALHGIDLRGDAQTSQGRDLGASPNSRQAVVVPVKILVDDEEPAARAKWEERLRSRIEAASAIFDELFHVKFEIVATGTWESSDDSADFKSTLREFIQTVDPGPARLAIGFTGQHPLMLKEKHLGGVQAPLHTHILIREWGPRITEIERLEVLVHELGHFLGAAHSPESESVMRPVLGDGRARLGNFRITFDPVNALSVYLLAEELRLRRVTNFRQLSLGTSLRLRQLYGVLAEVLPGDPAGAFYLTYLDAAIAFPPAEAGASLPEMPIGGAWPLAATRHLVQQLVAAAREESADPVAGSQARPRREGDELTAHYIRETARAAEQLQTDVAPRAFLLALGIGLDDSPLLRNHPLLQDFLQAVETSSERSQRLEVLGQPTMGGRRDLAQHFAVAAFVAASCGNEVAELASVAKELLDAHGGSGFSVADLAADHAGIAFAGRILEGKLTLSRIAGHFAVPDYLPDVADLPEGLRWEDFRERFGSDSDGRCVQLRASIREQIGQLPGYQASQSLPQTPGDSAIPRKPQMRPASR